MVKIVVICLAVIYGFVYLVLASKTGRPIRTILIFGALGLIAMTVLNLTSRYSGVNIPVNGYTIGINAALGLPGTIGLLFLRLLFGG